MENRVNGHAHAVWTLLAPLARTEHAHRKPLAYAAVTEVCTAPSKAIRATPG